MRFYAIRLVCYTAVFSVVTQRSDDTKNGCVADYYSPAVSKVLAFDYPSPNPTFCPKWEESVNVELGKR